MKPQLKLLMGVIGAAALIFGSVFAAFAGERALTGGAGVRVASAPGEANAAGCTKLTASDIAWATLDESGALQEQVESYPSGTTQIVPVFQYNCVPKKTAIVMAVYYDGESLGQLKGSLDPDKKKGYAWITVSYDSGEPLDDGTWSVEYYASKTLLTSGEVVIGEGGGDETVVTVTGTVTDKKTKKPIKGAVILILNPGTTVQDFVDGGQKAEDVFAAGKTDSKGKFVLLDPTGKQEQGLERNVQYAIIIAAKGYKTLSADDLEIGDDAPNPLELTITMSK